MATISKRSSNQFNVRIRHTGYPIRSKTFSTREEAALWAATIENEIRRGVYQLQQPEAERTTLSAALDRYANEVTPLKKSAESELCRVAAWQRNPLAQRFLGSLRGTDFAKYRDSRLAAGTAGNTIRLDLAVISHLFEVARKDWGMESLSNPVKNVRKPKLARGRDRRLLEGEEVRLLESCKGNHRLHSIIQLALATGMRRGELVKLRWADIDLDTCVLHLYDTKNESDRDVPLSSRATAALNALKATRAEQATRAADGELRERSDEPKVFPVKPNALSLGFSRACRLAGIKGLRFHDLRHEATSRLFELGLGVMEVSSITGHKLLGMLKRYTHLRAA